MLVTQHFAGSLKKLTERKFFGSYYHSLICHAPLHLRIFCSQTINTVKEEAAFNKLKTSTNLKGNEKKDIKVVYLKTLNYFAEENARISHEANSNKNDTPLDNPTMEIPSSENSQNRGNLSSIQATTSANYEDTKLPDTTFENTNNSSINSINSDTITSINPDTITSINPDTLP